jgi:hypothetical protein
MTEKECLEREPRAGNIFVLAPFKGPAFEYLEGYMKKSYREKQKNFE